MLFPRKPGPTSVLFELDPTAKLDEFEKWAFGEDFDGMTPMPDIPALWNARHKDLFEVKETDAYYKSLKKMMRRWLREKKKI